MNTHTFLINLDNHIEKRRKSTELLEKNGFTNIVRIPAVIGKEIDLDKIDITWYSKYLIDNPVYRCSHEQMNTKGAIGCYLSHVKCWELIIESGCDGAYIFEDDIEFVDNFITKFNKIILPRDCDLFSFGYNWITNPKRCSDGLSTCKTFTGTQCYFITAKGAEKLLKFVYPIEMQIDGFLSVMNYFNVIKACFSQKPLVIQRNDNSSINYVDCYKCYLPNVSTNTFIPYIFVIIILLVFLIILFLIKIKWIS